jgi:uncharacterized protein
MSAIEPSSTISAGLICMLKRKFQLEWNGLHGAGHWARVRQNGLTLAGLTGADCTVVEYFALLHDVCRQDDGQDPLHGPKAADFARLIRSTHIALNDAQFEELTVALEGHTTGQHHLNQTVATCWDADRLDLGRLDIYPDSERMCTYAARNPQLIKGAWTRSRMTPWERPVAALAIKYETARATPSKGELYG